MVWKWNIRRKLVICAVLCLLTVLVFSVFFVFSVGAVSLTLSPTSGKIYDRVNVSGTVVPPGYDWNVTFDMDGDGICNPSNERVTYGNSESSTVSSYFVVPPCAGSDSGEPHRVELSSEYPFVLKYLFVSAAAPYDPPFEDIKYFTVHTDRVFSTVTSVGAGVSIPIRLSITGGTPNIAYSYQVQVTKPDRSTVSTTFTTGPADRIGFASAAINFPGSFASSQNTNQQGTYSILVTETTPNPIFTRSMTVQVSGTPSPAYSPPNATITSINPNPSTAGTPITFNGAGYASSGYTITGYRWVSNISGEIGSASTFTTTTLGVGMHVISLEVRDNASVWSSPATATLRVNPGSTPTPTPSPTPSLGSGEPRTPTPTPTPPPSGSTPSPTPTSSPYGSTPTTSPGGPTPGSSSPTPTPPSTGTPTPSSSGAGGSSGGYSSGSGGGSQTSTGTPSPSSPNPSNQRPTATIITTSPASITQGQSIILTGEGFDSDGTIVRYTWTSSLSGVVSTSPQLDTANLVAGTHQLTFQVTDNDNALSEPQSITLTVNEVSNAPLVIGAAVGTATAIGAGAVAGALWFHYSNLTSFKIKTKLWKKNSQQQTDEQNQEKEDERRNKNQKRPRLIFSESKVPRNILQQTPYLAQFAIKNVGTDRATNITVHGLANPFVEYKDTPTPPEVSSLAPGETAQVALPFTTNADIRKNLYQVQFEVESKQTPRKLKRCFMRGAKIAVLTDEAQLAQPVLNWLSVNHYPFEEIHNAEHLMTNLYQYDLIIVSAQHEMPSKWVQNLCTYVENGQSVLLLDKISTSHPEQLDEALGYHEEADALNYGEAALEITKQHPITDGLSLGEHIPLGRCIGNGARFTPATPAATVLANSIDQSISPIAEVPVAAVMVKENGKGKIVHLNFHAQEHLNQIDRLVKNAVEWLLWD